MRKFWKRREQGDLPFFISIGAGLNQIPLIKEARKLGFHVIGVDTNPSAPGFMKCDLKIQESILNYNEIYLKLQELLVDGVIRGIMTKSFGHAIKTTAFLAEKFNIPFLPFSRCDAFTDKSLMKALFESHSISTSRIIEWDSAAKRGKIPQSSFPLVFKPRSGHAKKGVRLIYDMHELNACLRECGKTIQPFILEEYIRGDEVIALGIVNNGEFHLVEVTDKKTTPPPVFVDIRHSAPSRHEGLFAKIQHIGQKVARAFEIASSPLVMEFIVTGDGNLFLIEAVPEFGGEFLADILIPFRNGYNFIAEAIRACTATGFTPPGQKKKKKALVVQYIMGQQGVLASCNPQGPHRIKGTIFSRIFKEIGSEVKEPEDNLDRIGVVAVSANTPDQAGELATQAIDSFNIRIKK